LTLSPPREISRTAVNQLALPYTNTDTDTNTNTDTNTDILIPIPIPIPIHKTSTPKGSCVKAHTYYNYPFPTIR
jgi:hypothetical protein